MNLRLFSVFLVAGAMGMVTIAPQAILAQTCTLSGGDPQNAKSLVFESKSFTATLVGFDEFTGIANPRRVYRSKTVTGDHTYHIYQAADNCDVWWTDYIAKYDMACVYDKNTGALRSVNNSYIDYLGSVKPMSLSCSDGVGGTVTATSAVEKFGTGTCVPWGWYQGWYHAVASTGTVTATLSDEDTETDAKNRAVKSAGSSNTAFRTARSGLSFSECEVHYKAVFDVKCPGEYDIFLYYSIKPHGAAGPITAKTVVARRTLESGSRTVEGYIQVEERDVDYTLIGVQLNAPQCGAAPPAHSEISVGSVKVRLSLGRGVAGVDGGELRLDAPAITGATYTSAALAAVTVQGGGVEIIRDNVGALRQLKAPQTLADIVTLDSSSYEIRFYSLDGVGAQDNTTKIYALTSTSYATFRFENPDAAQGLSNRLRITETRGNLVRVYEYSYDSGSGLWSLSTGNSARREGTVITVAGADTTRVSTIRDENNVVVSKAAKTWRAYPWGSEVIQEVLDPDGVALTTTTDFYSNAPTDGGAYGHVKQRVNADSSWTRYTYDSAGRSLKIIRPYLNSVLTAADNLCRVTESAYSALPDADGDGVAEQLTTTTERILGQETARTYRIDWSKTVTLSTNVCTRRTDIRCVAAGAAWNAADNLITETLISTIEPFIGRECRILKPDGTAMLATYSVAANGVLTATVKIGVPNAGKDDIVDGRRTVTLTSQQGQVTGESVTDIASNLALTSWTATVVDSLGRPTRIDYADGTYVTRIYACCGLESERDRLGITTNYDYDAFGRTVLVARLGLKTLTTYDADGRVKTVSRVGTDNSTMLRETRTYDLAGRLTERKDALNRATAYAESYNSSTGETTRTTTNPDGGTIVEVSARDGSRLSVSGTAAAPHTYDYGIDTAGVFTKDTLIGVDTNNQPTATEWAKSYVDFAGRPLKTVFADNASQQSFYNNIGQLVRQVDPDGVTMLYAYNALGEQESTAVDLNGNNTIDAAGTDRLTKTLRVVGTKTDGSTYTVVRTTTKVWETDNQDTATDIVVAEQSSDGLRSWQTVRGLTTNTIITLDGSGGRTVTTTTPDGVKTIQVYSGDLPLSTTVKTATDVQLAATTYVYDAHGRVQSSTDARNGATTFTYFSDDQIATVTTPDPDATQNGAGYDAQTTTYAYDSAGRTSTITQSDGGVVTTTYWPTGAVKLSSGSRTYPSEYTYDLQGRVKTLTTWQNFAGASGKAVTTWNYDPARGFLLNKRYTDNSGPSYTYKPSGRLLTRTWSRTPTTITTIYSYNAAGDLTGTDYSDGTPDVAVAYDRSGRATTITDGVGTRTLSYHGSGQLQNESYTAGPLTGIAVNRTFDTLSRLGGLAVPSVTAASYAYDGASRLQTVTTGAQTFTYAYAANSSLVASVTFANGSATRLTTVKTYDQLNRLTSISNTPSTASLLSHAYAYNAANQRTRATREDNAYWSYTYDSLGQVTAGSKFLMDGAAALGLTYGYTYDDIGNRKTVQVNGQTATYTTTLLNRYAQRTVPAALDVLGAASSTARVTVAVNNDTPQATSRQGETFYRQVAVDNTSVAQYPSIKITGVKNLAGPNGEDAVTEIVKSAHIARTPETYTYDADGNLTDDARWHYSWDGENRLVAIETGALAAGAGVPRRKLEFSYDGQGRRMAKKVSNWTDGAWLLASHTLFLYDGWNMIAELNALSSNTVVRTYVWGLDLSGSLQGAGGVGGLLSVTDAVTGISHVAGYDGNGNVSCLVSSSDGTLTAKYDYNAFGETVLAEGAYAAANPIRFSTKFTDDETGYVYYGFRCYTPETGRWLSRDPIGEEGGKNLYAFVSNDGVNGYDLFGLVGPEDQLRPPIPTDPNRARYGDPLIIPKLIYYRLFETSDPLANKLLSHYMGGTGTPLYLSEDEMIHVGARANIKARPRPSKKSLEQYFAELRSGSGGGCNCVNVSNLNVEGGAGINGTLGGFTITYNGKLCMSAGGLWEFDGYMSFYDYWNFEPHRGATQRTATAEQRVATAAKYIIGRPFEVLSVSVKAKQYSTSDETLWSGTGSWEFAAASNRRHAGENR